MSVPAKRELQRPTGVSSDGTPIVSMSVPAKRELQLTIVLDLPLRRRGFDECPCEEGTATLHALLGCEVGGAVFR